MDSNSNSQLSDRLLHEIMQLEQEIDKIMALNGNRENVVVRKYRSFILARQNKLKKLNNNYHSLSKYFNN